MNTKIVPMEFNEETDAFFEDDLKEQQMQRLKAFTINLFLDIHRKYYWIPLLFQ